MIVLGRNTVLILTAKIIYSEKINFLYSETYCFIIAISWGYEHQCSDTRQNISTGYTGHCSRLSNCKYLISRQCKKRLVISLNKTSLDW